MGRSAYDMVLFDLGGVLVRLGGVPQMQALSGIDSEDALWARWLSCPWVRDFERGRCSPDDFAAGVIDEWGLGVTAEDFLERFRSWPEALFPGAVQLVDEVRTRCRVGCLSNTNQLHWAEQSSRWGLADLFEVAFLSYQLDLVKPDRAIFTHVTSALRLAPERILFLDDNTVNVEQARSVGLAGAAGAGDGRGPLCCWSNAGCRTTARDTLGPAPDKERTWQLKSVAWWRRAKASRSRWSPSSSPIPVRARSSCPCRPAGSAIPTSITARAASTTNSPSCSGTRRPGRSRRSGPT